MALDQLLEALAREAAATAERLRAEARTAAAAIETQAGAEADRACRVEVEKVSRARRVELEQEIAAARHAARERTLQARARLLDRVEDATRAAFPGALAGPDYLAALPLSLRSALFALPEQDEIRAACTPRLVPLVTESWPGPALAEVSGDAGTGHGFRLTDRTGGVEVEDTLEGRLAARRGVLHREALRRLGMME